jgi:hypothetical protein
LARCSLDRRCMRRCFALARERAGERIAGARPQSGAMHPPRDDNRRGDVTTIAAGRSDVSSNRGIRVPEPM